MTNAYGSIQMGDLSQQKLATGLAQQGFRLIFSNCQVWLRKTAM